MKSGVERRFGPLSGVIVVAMFVLSAPSWAYLPPPTDQAKGARGVDVPRIAFEKYQLDNGMTVILHVDDTMPLVAVNVTYHVGALYEPPKRSGFAHLFEHMMFEGSANLPGDRFFGLLSSRGARGINGVTTLDRTMYYETVPSHELELALWAESDRMGFLLAALDEASLANQKQVVLNERRQRTVDRAYGLVDAMIMKTIYPPPHPYAGNVIGSPEDIKAATLDECRQFFATYYSPQNATLALAGRFEPEATKALIDKYFGSLQGRPRDKSRYPDIPDRMRPKVIRVKEPLGQRPRVTVVWKGPRPYQLGAAELDMLSVVMNDPRTNPLVGHVSSYGFELVDVDTSFSEALGGSRFRIDLMFSQATVFDDKAIESLRLTIKRLSQVLSRWQMDFQLVHQGRVRHERNVYFGLQSLERRAAMLQIYEQAFGDPGRLEKDMERYRKVTPEGIRQAVDLFLQADPVVVIAVPRSRTKRAER